LTGDLYLGTGPHLYHVRIAASRQARIIDIGQSRSRPRPKSAQGESIVPRPLGGLVAIIEDDEDMRQAILRVLEMEGFQAELFSSAEAFLDSGAQSRVQCLVLDIRLPGMSGIDLHERLLSANCFVPTIFITAHEDVYRRRFSKSGAVCLAKPFLGEALVEKVTTAIEGRGRGSSSGT
jgi:FixJ family two-component response regulator